MPETAPITRPPRMRGPGDRALRVAHLTTVDLSLALLLRTELEVDVAAGLRTFGISAPGVHVAAVEELGVTHVPVSCLTRSWDPPSDLRAARELARVLRTLDLDVLHTHNPKTGVLGRVVGRLVGVPVVVNTCHGLWATPRDPRRKRFAVVTAEALAAAFSHAELYQNATDRATLRRWVRGRTEVVGNGVDLRRFVPDRAAGRQVRDAWGVGDHELLVGAVGRRVAEKGIREYAEAARSLRGRARFVWVGPEDHDKPDALGDVTGGAVQFVGERTDMRAVYGALDVFALPSHREGFSRSAMEAAACGLPMVLSDIRGCREIGRHGEELLLVPAGDGVALAGALDRLLADSSLRGRLGAAVRERAVAEFDQRAVAAASLRTYAGVAARAGLGWTGGAVVP